MTLCSSGSLRKLLVWRRANFIKRLMLGRVPTWTMHSCFHLSPMPPKALQHLLATEWVEHTATKYEQQRMNKAAHCFCHSAKRVNMGYMIITSHSKFLSLSECIKNDIWYQAWLPIYGWGEWLSVDGWYKQWRTTRTRKGSTAFLIKLL